MSSLPSQSDHDIVLKRLTSGGFAAIAAGLSAMVVLHAASGLNPVEVVISLHLYTPLGWLLPLSLTLFASGACVFAAAASRAGAPRWVSAMLLAWAALLGLVALFPTDPPGLDEVSVIAAVHRYSAFCAFVTMAVMGVCFGRWARDADRCSPRMRRAIAACGWIAAAALASCSTPYVMEWFGVPREPGSYAAGLLQRMTVGAELVVLVVLGGWLREHRAGPGRVLDAAGRRRETGPGDGGEGRSRPARLGGAPSGAARAFGPSGDGAARIDPVRVRSGPEPVLQRR